MSKFVFIGGKVLSPGGTLVPAALVTEGTKIAGITEENQIPGDATIIDVSGCIVAPGFIDTHVHGGGGHNFMEATEEACTSISEHMVQGGVTSCLATTTSSSLQDLMRVLEFTSARTKHPAAHAVEILGIHLEGPYLNPNHRGVHIEKFVRQATHPELEKIVDAAASALRVVTLAPEIPYGSEATRYFTEKGIKVSVGHTGATYEQTKWALANGACRGTHVFNAMPPIHHRTPGPIPALFEDHNATLEFIVDGHHIHPAMIKMAIKQIGVSRSILITDCTDVAGLGDGVFTRWEGTEVRIADGQSRTAKGSLAGSILRMDLGVKNLVEQVGLTLAQALQMASENPAKSIGVYDRKGSLSPGKDADIVVLNGDLSVRSTLIKGQFVYHNQEF